MNSWLEERTSTTTTALYDSEMCFETDAYFYTRRLRRPDLTPPVHFEALNSVMLGAVNQFNATIAELRAASRTLTARQRAALTVELSWLRLVDGGDGCVRQHFKHGGRVRRLTSNTGWEARIDARRPDYLHDRLDLAKAFSHWSFAASDGRRLVCGLRGALEPNGVALTNANVHSTDEVECKDDKAIGDLGEEGIARCLAAHRCGWICDALGLGRVSSPSQIAAQPISMETVYRIDINGAISEEVTDTMAERIGRQIHGCWQFANSCWTALRNMPTGTYTGTVIAKDAANNERTWQSFYE